ncbi:kelch domain-containing protein 2 isoform X2 [Anabrus simplex]|uniref:kelch domain-containing protein 2 isoform X2 n=1 Tax=Anabrus simplex TaxID=316456 RepID=UPI0035A2BB5C
MPDEPIITMRDKIYRRSGHIAVAYQECVIIWGGYVEHVQETSTSPIVSQYHDTDEIWVYDRITEVWERILTKGDIPPRNSGSCAVLLEDNLYVFGGYHGESDPGSMEGNSNQLYRLDLTTMTWEWLHPPGPLPAACDKLVGWTYQRKLYFFGGFGPPPNVQDLVAPIPFLHILDPSTQPSGWPRGWNNQLVRYDPESNRWDWPKSHGQIPSPRAAHAADLTGDKVYVFGGRLLNRRTNDLHCLDLKTMEWSGSLVKPLDQQPEGRSWHSFTFISPNRAVLYGGLNQFNTVLSDCWFLELPGCRWVKFTKGPNTPRLWHKAPFLPPGDLIIVGGHRNNILVPVINKVHPDHAEEVLVLNFTPKSLLRLCLDTVLFYGDVLYEEWDMLPRTLQKVLQLRMEQGCQRLG